MNGSPSLFEQLNERLPGQRMVKVGWDYNHFWDNEIDADHDLDEIVGDCKRAINDLRGRYRVKWHCTRCGAWSWSGPGDEHCGADDERRKA